MGILQGSADQDVDHGPARSIVADILAPGHPEKKGDETTEMKGEDPQAATETVVTATTATNAETTEDEMIVVAVKVQTSGEPSIMTEVLGAGVQKETGGEKGTVQDVEVLMSVKTIEEEPLQEKQALETREKMRNQSSTMSQKAMIRRRLMNVK